MNSFLGNLLCCCTRQKHEDSSSREREPLLPSSDEPLLLSYDATLIDPEQAKRRLDYIVSAKGGKMVKVISRDSPFNLRNQSGLGSTSESRSTRSPSANLSYYVSGSEQTPMGRRYDSSRRRPSSSISRSESTSSMQQASMSRVSDDMTDPYSEFKLRIKLIPSAKSNQRIFSRRGRSKTRQGRFRDDPENVPTLEGIQSVDSSRGEFYDTESHTLNGVSGVLKTGATSSTRPKVTPLNEEDNAAIKTISNELTQTLKDRFEDVGMLTRSWGD